MMKKNTSPEGTSFRKGQRDESMQEGRGRKKGRKWKSQTLEEKGKKGQAKNKTKIKKTYKVGTKEGNKRLENMYNCLKIFDIFGCFFADIFLFCCKELFIPDHKLIKLLNNYINACKQKLANKIFALIAFFIKENFIQLQNVF